MATMKLWLVSFILFALSESPFALAKEPEIVLDVELDTDTALHSDEAGAYSDLSRVEEDANDLPCCPYRHEYRRVGYFLRDPIRNNQDCREDCGCCPPPSNKLGGGDDAKSKIELSQQRCMVGCPCCSDNARLVHFRARRGDAAESFRQLLNMCVNCETSTHEEA